MLIIVLETIMRRIALLVLATAACSASSADITGTVTIGKNSSAMLSVGYIGLSQGKETLRNSCGMTVGANSSATSVWCSTYKPRNSELHLKNGKYTFKHVVLPPGQYYVYAKLGESLMLGRAVTIEKSTEMKRLDIDLSKAKTGNLALIVKSKGQWSVSIAPANAQGKALIKGLDLNQQLSNDSKVVNGKAIYRFLPEGKYIVELLKISQSGGTGGSHWEAYDVAGTFTVDVAPGKTLSYKLN